MNKFTAIVLLACVAMVSAAETGLEEFSQSALQPTDSEELASLTDKQQIFTDFCLKSRDYVIDDMKRTSNSMASGVFTMFFRSVEELGLESLETEKGASERLSAQLRNPTMPVPEGDDVVSQGARAIQTQNTPAGFFQAITSTLAAIKNNVANGVMQRLQKLKQNFTIVQAGSAVMEVCSKVSQYEEQMRSMFADYAAELASKDASMAGMSLDQIQCLTSKRILKIEGFCRFASIARGPLMKMLTYRS